MATEEPMARAPPPLRPHETDAVIAARLSVPDRPLRMLMAKLNAVLRSKDDEEIAHAITSFSLELESFVLNLAQVEAVAQQTTVHEVRSYDAQVVAINAQRQATVDAIAALKRELVDVQQDRQNKLEYDALANEIMKYDTRDELEASLAQLRDTIDSLRSESSKFVEIMQTSQERFEGVASQLEALRADVGYEVGERERRAVERGGEDGGEGGDDDAAAGAAAVDATRSGHEATGGEQEGGGGGEKHDGSSSRARLNPAAAAFRPVHAGSSAGVSRATTPGADSSTRRGSGSASGKRDRSSRRTAHDVDEDERQGSTLKKVHVEADDDDDDDEEEEGAA